MDVVKFDIRKVVFEDLSGNVLTDIPIEQIGEVIGNMMYAHARTIEEDELSRAIHRPKEIDTTKEALQLAKTCVMSDNLVTSRMIRNSILKYIDSLL